MPTTDVLVLAVARQGSGLVLAGMTTERDPKTGLRWVRPIPPEGRFDPEMLHYEDGSLVRPGDVVRLPLGAPEAAIPHVENVPVELDDQPLQRVRRLTPERREAFFVDHLDQSPTDVLRDRSRSLCLVRPDFVHAIISFDEETGRFDTRLALMVGKLRSNDEGIFVSDVYWRALMHAWLGDQEYMEVDDNELQSRLGDMYVVIGLGRKANPLILGVHTVPEYEVIIDEDAL
jgi:hypothetical protein